MKAKRLDKIIEDNVTFSTKKTDIQQVVYILQDISETLAMIYDEICSSAINSVDRKSDENNK